jgi:hypothetical protein
MYEYLKKIPDIEYHEWAEQFYREQAGLFPEHTKEEFDETWFSWVGNLKDDETRHQTKVIKHYDLTLAARDFFNTVLREERDRLVDTYPEAFI